MPLPWTAPGMGQGIFPSQAPFFIPDKVDPRLIASIVAEREHNQQQISGAIQSAFSSIGKMMDQHRQDAIASQLLAGSAPQAEAFTPAGEPTPVGTPSATMSEEEKAHNAALGYPTQQLMTPSETYGARDAMVNQNLSDMHKMAVINHMNRLGYQTDGQQQPNVWTDPNSGKRFAIGPSGGLHELSGTDSQVKPVAAALSRGLSTHGETMANFLSYYDKPGVVTYWNKDYKNQISSEDATKDPEARAVLPNASSMKLGDYQKLQRRAETVSDYSTAPTAGEGGDAGGNVGGYISGKQYGGRTYLGGDPFNESNWR